MTMMIKDGKVNGKVDTKDMAEAAYSARRGEMEMEMEMGTPRVGFLDRGCQKWRAAGDRWR